MIENEQQVKRSLLSLTADEMESTFKIAFYQDQVSKLKVDLAEHLDSIQLSNGDYLIRLYQDGSMRAQLDYKDGAGVHFNALAVIRYLSEIGVELKEQRNG